MKLNAAMLMAALMLSGTVLAQSSGPSAGGPVDNGQGANVTTTGQAQNDSKKTGDSGPPIEKAAKPDEGSSSATVGSSRSQKPRRQEHYP
ncbi:hypothetical protein ACFFWD_21035 [Bradyrhizobium erythrophlei]|uniref:hypothetical protein n=1 Tax=Bradyrhizobium erythrophlei TaxID=1437360 RepID=UPI0035E6648B